VVCLYSSTLFTLGWGGGVSGTDELIISSLRVLFSVTTYFAIVDVLHHRNTGESAHKTQHNAHLGV
jgi:hypothetical protein